MSSLLLKYVAGFFLLTTLGMSILAIYRGEVISQYQTEAVKASNKSIQVIIDSTELANKISEDLEVKQTTLTVEKKEVIREIETIVKDPIYVNVCFNDAGMSALRKAISSPTPDELSESMPAVRNAD